MLGLGFYMFFRYIKWKNLPNVKYQNISLFLHLSLK